MDIIKKFIVLVIGLTSLQSVYYPGINVLY